MFPDEYKRANCELAKQLFKEEIVCSCRCPAFDKCPQLILENAHLDSDEVYNKALNEARKALAELVRDK